MLASRQLIAPGNQALVVPIIADRSIPRKATGDWIGVEDKILLDGGLASASHPSTMTSPSFTTPAICFRTRWLRLKTMAWIMKTSGLLIQCRSGLMTHLQGFSG